MKCNRSVQCSWLTCAHSAGWNQEGGAASPQIGQLRSTWHQLGSAAAAQGLLCSSGLPGKALSPPSPVTSSVTPSRHCTTPLHHGSGCCAGTGTAAGSLFLGHTRNRHLQGNGTSNTTLMQSLPCLQLILT